jgi:hypothetical protein
MSATSVAGSCHCGAVKFTLRFPTKFFAHCHCDDCRRAHGAPVVSWVGIPEDQFVIEQGTDDLVRYDSSAAAWRQFCRHCGTTLTFAGDRWPGEIHIAAANLEGPVDREPQAHVYFDRSPDWFEVGDELPRLGGESGVQPLTGN